MAAGWRRRSGGGGARGQSRCDGHSAFGLCEAATVTGWAGAGLCGVLAGTDSMGRAAVGTNREGCTIGAMTPSTRSLVVRVFLWLGGHELGVLLAVAGIVGGVWMFAEIADQVIDGGTQMLDRKLLLSMRRPDLTPIGPPALHEASRHITAFGW